MSDSSVLDTVGNEIRLTIQNQNLVSDDGRKVTALNFDGRKILIFSEAQQNVCEPYLIPSRLIPNGNDPSGAVHLEGPSFNAVHQTLNGRDGASAITTRIESLKLIDGTVVVPTRVTIRHGFPVTFQATKFVIAS